MDKDPGPKPVFLVRTRERGIGPGLLVNDSEGERAWNSLVCHC